MNTIPLHLDGYTVLPQDKIAFVVTYLEMTEKPDLTPVSRSDLALEQQEAMSAQAFRDVFRRIGEPWLWFGRLTCADDELEALLAQTTREVYLPMKDGNPVGLLELDFADPQNVELTYFGLTPEVVGGGAGRWLMNQALEIVWGRERTRRFWLHTCTGDSPQALGFYQRSGFVPFKRAIEVADDPRGLGVLPKDAGPHLPFLNGK